MSITVKRTVPQISLIPYGSPGFDEVISTLGVTPMLGRGNQYLVGIKIGTIPHPITEVWLFYEVTDGGKVVQDVWCLAPGRLRTGDAYLDAPAPWHQMAEGLMACAEPKYIDVPIPPMPADKLAGKRIRASVDAVVYDDGTFSGPDTLNLFAQLSSKDQQIREFLNSLADQLSSGTPDEEIGAWLESRAVKPDLRNFYEVRFAAAAIFKEAHRALRMFQRVGRSAFTAFAKQRARIANSLPVLHKE